MKLTPERLSRLEEYVRRHGYQMHNEARENFDRRLRQILTPENFETVDAAMSGAKGNPGAIPSEILAIIQADPEADRLMVQVRFLLPLAKNFLGEVAKLIERSSKEWENDDIHR